MIVTCDVIKDLLPLVEEDLASADSSALVEAHLADCEVCRRERERLRQSVGLPLDTDTRMLEGVRKNIRTTRRRGMAATALVVLLAAVLAVIHLNSPIYLSLGEGVETLTLNGAPITVTWGAEKGGEMVTRGEPMTLGLTFRQEVAGCEVEPVRDPEEELTGLTVLCWTTRWHQLFSRQRTTLQVVLGETNEVGNIWYCPADGTENELLWPGGGSVSGGFATLPRLVLNYYLIIALLLGAVGLVIGFLLRRRDEKRTALRLAMVPVCYGAAHFLVLWGKEDIYNALYYLTGILLAAGVLYGLFHLLYRWGRERNRR